MTHTDNVNNINQISRGNVYRFPSWYQPKPVQLAQPTGTEPVCPTAQDAEQGEMCHPGTVPVLCTGNNTPCTGKRAITPLEDEAQPFENAAHALEAAPEVPEVPVSGAYNRSQVSAQASSGEASADSHLPPPYPGHPVGAPFRPGHQVWLYRWDDQTPRFDVPVTIVEMRTLWAGEQDIGWCNAAGELTWHNARLAVAIETREGLSHPEIAL